MYGGKRKTRRNASRGKGMERIQLQIKNMKTETTEQVQVVHQ
jgi:hypothetical protein